MKTVLIIWGLSVVFGPAIAFIIAKFWLWAKK